MTTHVLELLEAALAGLRGAQGTPQALSDSDEAALLERVRELHDLALARAERRRRVDDPTAAAAPPRLDELPRELLMRVVELIDDPMHIITLACTSRRLRALDIERVLCERLVPPGARDDEDGGCGLKPARGLATKAAVRSIPVALPPPPLPAIPVNATEPPAWLGEGAPSRRVALALAVARARCVFSPAQQLIAGDEFVSLEVDASDGSLAVRGGNGLSGRDVRHENSVRNVMGLGLESILEGDEMYRKIFIARPRRVSALATVRVVGVALGTEHAGALDACGRVYTWGDGDGGQLGHGTLAQHGAPRVVAGLLGTPVVALALGYRHSLALSAGGALYAWGSNTIGECGLGEPVAIKYNGVHYNGLTLQPTRVGGGALAGARCVRVATGMTHSVVVGADGCAYAFGSNRDGALGLGDPLRPGGHRAHTPTRVALDAPPPALGGGGGGGGGPSGAAPPAAKPGGARARPARGSKGKEPPPAARAEPSAPPPPSPSAVVEVACGPRHTILLDRTGRVFTCGHGALGVLGHGDARDRHVPTRVEGVLGDAAQACAGRAFSAVLCADGSAYTWGCNQWQCLGYPLRPGENPETTLQDRPRALESKFTPNRAQYNGGPIAAVVGCGSRIHFVQRADGRVKTHGFDAGVRHGDDYEDEEDEDEDEDEDEGSDY